MENNSNNNNNNNENTNNTETIKPSISPYMNQSANEDDGGGGSSDSISSSSSSSASIPIQVPSSNGDLGSSPGSASYITIYQQQHRLHPTSSDATTSCSSSVSIPIRFHRPLTSAITSSASATSLDQTPAKTTADYISLFLSALTEAITTNRAISLRNSAINVGYPQITSPALVSPYHSSSNSVTPTPLRLSRSPDPSSIKRSPSTSDSAPATTVFVTGGRDSASPDASIVHVPTAAKPSGPLPQSEMANIPFNNKKIPGISLGKYLQRIAHYLSPSPACLLVTMVYMDRILYRKEAETGIYLSDYNVHRMLISCVVLASKFWSDNFYNDSYYAKVGGVSMADMVKLETTALAWMDFRLIVNSEELFEEYSKMVQSTKYALIVPGLMKKVSIDPIMADIGMKEHFDLHKNNIIENSNIGENIDENVEIVEDDEEEEEEEGEDKSENKDGGEVKVMDRSHHVSTCLFRVECPCGCGEIVVPPFQALLRELRLGDSAADDRGPVTEKK